MALVMCDILGKAGRVSGAGVERASMIEQGKSEHSKLVEQRLGDIARVGDERSSGRVGTR
jgi:hypothetical protein